MHKSLEKGLASLTPDRTQHTGFGKLKDQTTATHEHVKVEVEGNDTLLFF